MLPLPRGGKLASVALPVRIPLLLRQRPPRVDHALQFLDSLESTWKGNEKFAIWLVQKIRPKTIVDLGFDRGFSTLAFAYKNRGHVFGIDWFDEGKYVEKSFALDSAFCNISDAIRLNYAKNIHLIIGPFRDVCKKWTRKIDILHIDWSHTYSLTKQHYTNWLRFLKPQGIVLVHDVIAFKEETGRFFDELALPKFLFPHGRGLGVASANASLIEMIQEHWVL